MSQHARSRWPALAKVQVRFRAQFAYVDGYLPNGEVLPLCRLRYGGSASSWGFGQFAGSPEDALDCACGLYLNDPTAW